MNDRHNVSALLSLEFEYADLSILAHVRDLSSADEARSLLAIGPSLSIQSDGIWLQCGDKVLREINTHCEPSPPDECVRWKPDSDRTLHSDWFRAQISALEMFSLCCADNVFNLSWFGITEYENHPTSGRFLGIRLSTTGIPSDISGAGNG